MATLME